MKRLKAFVPLLLAAPLPSGCESRATVGAGATGLVGGTGGDDGPGETVGDVDHPSACLAGRCGERDTLRKDGMGDGMAAERAVSTGAGLGLGRLVPCRELGLARARARDRSHTHRASAAPATGPDPILVIDGVKKSIDR